MKQAAAQGPTCVHCGSASVVAKCSHCNDHICGAPLCIGAQKRRRHGRGAAPTPDEALVDAYAASMDTLNALEIGYTQNLVVERTASGEYAVIANENIPAGEYIGPPLLGKRIPLEAYEQSAPSATAQRYAVTLDPGPGSRAYVIDPTFGTGVLPQDTMLNNPLIFVNAPHKNRKGSTRGTLLPFLTSVSSVAEESANVDLLLLFDPRSNNVNSALLLFAANRPIYRGERLLWNYETQFEGTPGRKSVPWILTAKPRLKADLYPGLPRPDPAAFSPPPYDTDFFSEDDPMSLSFASLPQPDADVLFVDDFMPSSFPPPTMAPSTDRLLDMLLENPSSTAPPPGPPLPDPSLVSLSPPIEREPDLEPVPREYTPLPTGPDPSLVSLSPPIEREPEPDPYVEEYVPVPLPASPAQEEPRALPRSSSKRRKQYPAPTFEVPAIEAPRKKRGSAWTAGRTPQKFMENAGIRVLRALLDKLNEALPQMPRGTMMDSASGRAMMESMIAYYEEQAREDDVAALNYYLTYPKPVRYFPRKALVRLDSEEFSKKNMYFKSEAFYAAVLTKIASWVLDGDESQAWVRPAQREALFYYQAMQRYAVATAFPRLSEDSDLERAVVGIYYKHQMNHAEYDDNFDGTLRAISFPDEYSAEELGLLWDAFVSPYATDTVKKWIVILMYSLLLTRDDSPKKPR